MFSKQFSEQENIRERSMAANKFILSNFCGLIQS